jgi:hypothetical protein
VGDLRLTSKKKRKQAKKLSDLGPAERLGHDKVQLEETMQAGVVRARVTTQTAIDRYRQREQINAMQFDAAEKFRTAWYIGCRGASVTANYDVRFPATASSTEDHTASARLLVNNALKAVGNQLSPVIIHTCGLDLSADSWASRHGHSGRSGLTVLKLGLDALAEHFGYQ